MCCEDSHRRGGTSAGVARFSGGGGDEEAVAAEVGVQALCWQTLAAGWRTHFLIRDFCQSPAQEGCENCLYTRSVHTEERMRVLGGEWLRGRESAGASCAALSWRLETTNDARWLGGGER
jgi:hypothetical protein